MGAVVEQIKKLVDNLNREPDVFGGVDDEPPCDRVEHAIERRDDEAASIEQRHGV